MQLRRDDCRGGNVWCASVLQYRHYKACLDIFKLRPSKESREFADLVGFMAQVSRWSSQGALQSHTVQLHVRCYMFGAALQLHAHIYMDSDPAVAACSGHNGEHCLPSPQVASCYPKEVQGFSAEVSGLLEEQATALDSATRLALVGNASAGYRDGALCHDCGIAPHQAWKCISWALRA